MKQETIEQAAERILENSIDGLSELLPDDDLFFFYKGVIQCYGEAMAEWQQEQDQKLYSEEDMKQAFTNGSWVTSWSDMGIEMKYDNFETWFQQFKKK